MSKQVLNVSEFILSKSGRSYEKETKNTDVMPLLFILNLNYDK